jgi:Uma2 family endonuclease
VSAHWEKLITYPDVTFGCPPFEIGPENTLLNPIVLGEVLSPSTSHHDRVTKAAYYRGIPSLRHYLLVEPERVEVVHGWRDEGFWKSETFTDLAAEIRLQGIEVTLPVAAIYAKTEGLS